MLKNSYKIRNPQEDNTVMKKFSNTYTLLCVMTALIAILIAAPACKQGGKVLSGRSGQGGADQPRSNPKPENDSTTNRGSSDGNVTLGVTSDTTPEMWLFGASKKPSQTELIDATGIRMILDLRKLDVKVAGEKLRSYTDRGLGLALTVRWANTVHKGDRPLAEENFDTPPSTKESKKAIKDLVTLLGSKSARKLGDRLVLQFYNEVAGGPGSMNSNTIDELLAFATETTKQVRKANPELQICGPSMTTALFLFDPDEAKAQRNAKDKEIVVNKSIEWSAKYADLIDLHIHGKDGTDARIALRKLRDQLDAIGGKRVGIVTYEWSCARFEDRENDEAVANAIRGIWNAMSDHNVLQAAYGPYWPMVKNPRPGVRDRFGWATVVDTEGNPNPVICKTLRDLERKNEHSK